MKDVWDDQSARFVDRFIPLALDVSDVQTTLDDLRDMYLYVPVVREGMKNLSDMLFTN